MRSAFPVWFHNSVLVTLSVTFGRVFIDSLAGYALARLRFYSIVLPMARPALITLIILSFQGSWNELSHFIVASQDPQLMTLTKGVAQLASGALSQGSQYPIKLAAAVIMTIPVAILFFIFQKKIMNNSEGGVKG